jgi:hypothetical protein
MRENRYWMQNRIAELEAQLAAQKALLACAVVFDLGSGLRVSRCSVITAHWIITLRDWQIWDRLAGQWRYIPARSHHWTTDFLAATRFTTREDALAQAYQLRDTASIP